MNFIARACKYRLSQTISKDYRRIFTYKYWRPIFCLQVFISRMHMYVWNNLKLFYIQYHSHQSILYNDKRNSENMKKGNIHVNIKIEVNYKRSKKKYC